MSIESPVKLLARSLLSLTLVLSASGIAIAQPLPKVSSTASLSDTVLDVPSTAPTNSLARSGSRNAAKSGSKRNDVGIGFRFGDSTSVGIDAKFALSNNISLRPSIYFGNTIGGGNSSSSGSSGSSGSLGFGLVGGGGLSGFNLDPGQFSRDINNRFTPG